MHGVAPQLFDPHLTILPMPRVIRLCEGLKPGFAESGGWDLASFACCSSTSSRCLLVLPAESGRGSSGFGIWTMTALL